MDSPELVEAALRVISAVSRHESPNPRDLAALKNAAPAHRNDAAGDLACYVVETQLKTRAAKATAF